MLYFIRSGNAGLRLVTILMDFTSRCGNSYLSEWIHSLLFISKQDRFTYKCGIWICCAQYNDSTGLAVAHKKVGKIFATLTRTYGLD